MTSLMYAHCQFCWIALILALIALIVTGSWVSTLQMHHWRCTASKGHRHHRPNYLPKYKIQILILNAPKQIKTLPNTDGAQLQISTGVYLLIPLKRWLYKELVIRQFALHLKPVLVYQWSDNNTNCLKFTKGFHTLMPSVVQWTFV